MSSSWVIDTDMLIHRRSVDPKLRKAAQDEIDAAAPVSVAAFSFVEFKGNYIQDLILLRNKVADSDSLGAVYARADKVGGRRARMMVSQMVLLLEAANLPTSPWDVCQSAMLVHLDTELLLAWNSLSQVATAVADPFKCTRAAEPLEQTRNAWSAAIPKCTPMNTSCTIVNFSTQLRAVLQKIVGHLQSLGARTDELERILEIAKEASTKPFPWERQVCRKVGDLLIGLTSLSGRGLITSNKKEHEELSRGAGYGLQLFDVVAARS